MLLLGNCDNLTCGAKMRRQQRKKIDLSSAERASLESLVRKQTERPPRARIDVASPWELLCE